MLFNNPYLCTVSIVMQGKQMVPVLNSLGIHASVYGNHEFGEFVCTRTCVQSKIQNSGNREVHVYSTCIHTTYVRTCTFIHPIDPLHVTSRGARGDPHWRTAGAVCYGENVHRPPLPLVCKERRHHFFL